MPIVNLPETAAKSRTIDGLPCILIERKTPNASGNPSESETIAVFKDSEIGNALADDFIDRLNHGKIRT